MGWAWLAAIGAGAFALLAVMKVGRPLWSMVAAASVVGVLVIDWTLIGASPPTATEPTMIWRLLRRSMWRQGRMWPSSELLMSGGT